MSISHVSGASDVSGAEPLQLSDQTLIHGSAFAQASGRLTGQGLRDLRAKVVAKMQTYPYFAVIRDFPGVENAKDLTRIAKKFGPFSRTFQSTQTLARCPLVRAHYAGRD